MHSISPTMQQALDRWYSLSLLSICFVILCLAGITAYMNYQLKKEQLVAATLKKQTINTDMLATTLQDLHKKKDSLATQQQKYHRLCQSKINLVTFLEKIARLMPPEACLTQLNYAAKNSISLEGLTTNPHTATSLLQILSNNLGISNLELIFLRPHSSAKNSSLYTFGIQTKQIPSRT